MISGQEIDTIQYVLEETDEEIVFHRPSTPYQALRLLPRNATPSQQDSIVQLYCKPVIVCPSDRPDTLKLPGLEGARYNLDDVPQYKDGFFTGNEYLHTELKVTFPGIAGDAIPYRLRNDIFITSTLLICFFAALFIITRFLHVLLIQLKNFFYNRDRNETILLNRDSEMKTQTYVNLLTSFLVAIMFLHYTSYAMPDVFNRISPYKLLLLNTCICFAFLLTKFIGYQITNWTFFSQQNKGQWNNIYNLLTLIKAISYFLLTLVIVYFDLPIHVSIWILSFLIFTFILLLSFKAKQIFFNYNLALIHLFLYLCTLEIIPLLALGWVLVEANMYTLVFI